MKELMESKWNEMKVIENERSALFNDFEANKDRIAELHFEVEIKKLEYLFLKRQQLSERKRSATYAIVANSATSVEFVNETCIKLLQRQLIEHGFEDRLKQEHLI